MKTADELIQQAETEKATSTNPLDPFSTFNEDISHLDTSKLPQLDAYNLAIINERGEVVKTLNNEDLKIKSSQLLEFMFNDIKINKKFYNAHNLLKDIVEVKKAFLPEIAKNLNINATNVFDDYINKWKAERLKVRNEEQVNIELKEVEKEVEVENVHC